MKPHYIMITLSFFLLTAGCIEPVTTDPVGVTPSPMIDVITELPLDHHVPSHRDSFFFRFDGWEDPSEYTSFPPPAYIPGEYVLYDLQIVTILNATEPRDHRTTISETLRYARNDTVQSTPGTTDMALLEISWSEYGYNPYAKDRIVNKEPEFVDINGYTGQIYETPSERLIVWTAAGNATYRVRGSLNCDELIRMARSIVC